MCGCNSRGQRRHKSILLRTRVRFAIRNHGQWSTASQVQAIHLLFCVSDYCGNTGADEEPGVGHRLFIYGTSQASIGKLWSVLSIRA
jgi:hypothetical protein